MIIIEEGQFYQTISGSVIGPMKRWGDFEHGWEQEGETSYYSEGGDIWRDNGTSDYGMPILLREYKP